MYCFCCYINAVYEFRAYDNVAFGTRTFLNLHYISNQEKVQDVFKRQERSDIYIYQASVTPPHFKIVFLREEIGEVSERKLEIWDVGRGRNNMFQCILVFLWHVREQHFGAPDAFADYNLGPQGLNMLRILAW